MGVKAAAAGAASTATREELIAGLRRKLAPAKQQNMLTNGGDGDGSDDDSNVDDDDDEDGETEAQKHMPANLQSLSVPRLRAVAASLGVSLAKVWGNRCVVQRYVKQFRVVSLLLLTYVA
jgi:hypothetical protein